LWSRFVTAKNPGVAGHDEPAGVDAGPARVADQRAQHLRDAAAARRRVHVPERPAVEQLTPAFDRALEAGDGVTADHLAEPLRRQRRHDHVLELGGLRRHAESIPDPARDCTPRAADHIAAGSYAATDSGEPP
jgi:hypothetical protein